MIAVYIVHGDVMETMTVRISVHDQVQMRRTVLLLYDHQHNRHLCGQMLVWEVHTWPFFVNMEYTVCFEV